MEEVVVRDHKDTGELLVVVSHHGGARSLLGHGEEVMDVLDGAEGLLPELELDGGIELGKGGVEVTLKGVLVGEVDGMGVVRVTGNVLEMLSEHFAETTELGLALVLEAELESLVGDLLVGHFETSIVAKDVESSAVGLPEELEPRGDEDAVGTVLVLVGANGAEEHALGGLGLFEIVDVDLTTAASALDWASTTLASASLMKCLMTSSMDWALVFCDTFLYCMRPSWAIRPSSGQHRGRRIGS